MPAGLVVGRRVRLAEVSVFRTRSGVARPSQLKHQEESPGCEMQTEMGAGRGDVRVFPGAKAKGWEGESEATVIGGQCINLTPGRQTTLTS